MLTSRDAVIGLRSRATAADFFNGLLVLLEGHVPVVIADEPLPGGEPSSHFHGETRRPSGAKRWLYKPHADLLRRTIALSYVAGNASENAVFPVRLAAAAPGNHMVDAEIPRGADLSAVLATVGIASVEVAS